MKNELSFGIRIKLKTIGEESTRDADGRELPGIAVFIKRCNALADALSIQRGAFFESTEDIDGGYPNCLWFGTMTFSFEKPLSFLEADRLVNIIQNFALLHSYQIKEASAHSISV